MVGGAVAGVSGIVLHSDELKTVAKWSLALGVVIAFVPLTAAVVHSLYRRLRNRKRGKE